MAPYTTARSKQTGPRTGPFLKDSGGEDRNRTCLGGFAGSWETAKPIAICDDLARAVVDQLNIDRWLEVFGAGIAARAAINVALSQTNKKVDRDVTTLPLGVGTVSV
jgi:hypothetical protein